METSLVRVLLLWLFVFFLPFFLCVDEHRWQMLKVTVQEGRRSLVLLHAWGEPLRFNMYCVWTHTLGFVCYKSSRCVTT
jgi:hypothetical protein